MADKENKDKNEYKDKRKTWWIWTAVAIVIFIILLLIFNTRSTVIADDQQPTTIGNVLDAHPSEELVYLQKG